jgi:enoyl-[acyl-carrier protein] reductase II
MMELAAGVRAVYFEGDLEGGVALSGEVAGRIGAVEPVADIVARTVREFAATVARLTESVGP